ncbi:MAG: type II secretion system F family protein [Firmicutes bacterium]|nr:type II secretion system F family protein [Bacillota bacterium]MCL5039831.1 type II secretion system F family protein [Bacillota bacterium]
MLELVGAVLASLSLFLSILVLGSKGFRRADRLKRLESVGSWFNSGRKSPLWWEERLASFPPLQAYHSFRRNSLAVLRVEAGADLLTRLAIWEPLSENARLVLQLLVFLVASLISPLLALSLLGVWLLPDLWLWRTSQIRRREMIGELIRIIDHLTISLVNGPNLRQALDEVARREGRLNLAIAQVLRQDVSGGKVGTLLQGLGRELGLPQLESFAVSLLQAETLGTPLAEILQRQARAMRRERRQSLEKRINLLPLGLTLITVVFLLPPILVVVLLPNVIGFLRSSW